MRELKKLTGKKAKLVFLAAPKSQCEVELVAHFRNNTLLVSHPANADFHLGQRYQIRFTERNVIHSYHVNIARLCNSTYLCLQMIFPADQSLVAEHRAPRVKLEKKEIKITLQDGKQKVPVSVADISVSGAQLVADIRLGNINDVFHIELSINNGMSSIRLPCKIRYVRMEPEPGQYKRSVSFHHGVEFLQLPVNVENYLLRFVS